MAEPLHSSPGDHESQLASLGLKLEYFYDALRAGEQARRLVTRNDPRNAGGTDDYFKRVRVLRERLIAGEHWSRGELDCLPLVINADRTMAIGVLLGDHMTGWVGPYHPRSKRPVGDLKRLLVAHNYYQPALIAHPVTANEVSLDDEDLSKLKTWFFVTHRRYGRDGISISSELSLPSGISENCYVERWARRIPFPDLVFEHVKPPVDDDTEDGGGYDVSVDER